MNISHPPPSWMTSEQSSIYCEHYDCVEKDMLRELEAYAVERSQWLDAVRFLAENGTVLVLRNEKGVVIKVQEDPRVRIAEKSRVAMLKLARLLGLA